ncbi:MAG: PAS domain-containing protein [Lachnospiraceae bacterium]|nr:PAS domain-containing protein [Lachnospiraceae bacterium]
MEKIKTIHQLKDEILNRLYCASKIDTAVEDVLELTGLYFNVSRVYVFENSEDDLCTSNTFEWCNGGILPQITKLQNVRYLEDMGGGWYDNYNEDGLFFCPDVKRLPCQQRRVLEPQDIHGMLQCAIKENGVYKGFIGFDNCNCEKQSWETNTEAVDALIFISRMLTMFLLQQRSKKSLEESKIELEKALLQANTTNRGIIDNIPGVVVIFHVVENQIKLMYVSEGCRQVTGYTDHELLERYREKVYIDIHPEDIHSVKRQAAEGILQGKAENVTFRLRRKDGNYRWVNARVSPSMPEEPYCFYGICMDVSKEREASLMMEQLVNALPGGVAIYRIGSKIETVYASDGLAGLTGRTRKEHEDWIRDRDLIAQTVYEDDAERIRRLVLDSVARDEQINVTYRIRHKDGGLIWVQLLARKIREDKGAKLYYATYSIPKEEAALYQNIVEDSNTAVVILQKKDRKIMFANGAWKDLEGIPLDEQVIGRKVFEVIPEENRIFTEKEVQELPYDFCRVFHKVRSNGMHLQISARSVLWNGIDCYTSYIIDETEIQNTRERLEKLIDEVPGGIIICRIRQGRISLQYANDGYLRMLGDTRRSREIFLGDKMMEAIHPNDRGIVWQMAERFEQGEDFQDVIYRIKNGARDYYWIRLMASVVERNQEAITLYGSVSDVDEIEEKQKRELHQALCRVKEANNAKTEFFSRMSHDMRTPMNGILGLASLSEGEEDVKVLKENIAKIRTSGEYLLGLINDTLDFQKIESGKMKIVPQVVECSSFIGDMLEMVKISAREKQIIFKEEVDYQAIFGYVRIDPIRMKQVFLNLLSNAIKFTPEQGTVCFRVVCGKMEGNVKHPTFFIEDTGIGMSEEFLQHKIFQSFTQEYNQMSAQYAGSGLGLSIVKKLVDMMGGTIEVASALGKGTVFTIHMGVEAVDARDVEDQVISKTDQKNSAQASLRGRHILLIEDHALNAEIAKRLLQKAGCRVTWAENGQIGMTKFMESELEFYDAILMDIRMPVMDGLTAARSIRNLPRRDAGTVPILAMTANAYEEDVKKSKDAGMNDHLSKPIEPQKLYEALENWIGTADYLSGSGRVMQKEGKVSLDTLKKMVRYVWKEEGAFSVAYGSFNSIYQFLERNLSRTKQNIQILLFTVLREDGSIPGPVELKPIMETLNQAIQHSLREGDLTMEFNKNQCAVLLVNCDGKNGRMVAVRVLKAYQQNGAEGGIKVNYEISCIQERARE